MKITFFSSGLAYYLGGPAFSEGSLIAELQKRHTVSVFLSKGRFEKKLLEDYGIKNVYEFEKQDFAELYFQKTSFMYKEITTADVVHLNGHWKWWYKPVSDLCVHSNTPYVLHPRGMLLVGHRKKWIKQLFNLSIGNSIVKRAGAVIALSEYEKQQFAPYSIPENRIPVIPNGIPVLEKLSGERPQLPTGVENYFLYIGRIESRKNLIFLIDAFNLYAKNGKSALLIVGPAEHGYEKELKRHAEQLGLKDKVHVLEGVYAEEKDRLLQSAAAVIYPSNDEPFGRVPFEAIACNAFPIVPDQSGANEYLKPFLPQCIYAHKDMTSLAQILKDIEIKKAAWTPSLKEAKNWVRTGLNWVAITQQIEKLYSNLAQLSTATFPSRQIRES